MQVLGGDPALADEALLGHIHVEQIERMIYGLHLLDHDRPRGQILGDRCEHTAAMILGLAEHQLQILEASTHILDHLLALNVRAGTGIQRGMEAGAHLLDAILQLLALEEGHKDGLEDGMTGGWIIQRFVQIGTLKEHIATRDAPQHALKAKDALTIDDARHESKTTTMLDDCVIATGAATIARVQIEHLLVGEEALGILQHLAQFRQLQIVGLHVDLVLGQLNHLRLGLLQMRLQINDLTWIGRPRNIILDIGQRNAVLLNLRFDVAYLSLQLIATTHLRHELALEDVHRAVQLWNIKRGLERTFVRIVRPTYVAKLHTAGFAQLRDGGVCGLWLYKHLA